jgi:photosystem II stability/assembly factor-like uncharacterized protein
MSAHGDGLEIIAISAQRRRPLGWLAVAVAMILAGCSLPIVGDLQRPTQIPSFTPPPATMEATATPSATPVTPTPSGPPTEAPPELGEPVDLSPLAAGTEAVIQQIEMFDSNAGWAVGGVAGDDQRVLTTADGGQTWHDASPPVFFAEGGAELRTAAFFLDVNHAWALRYTPVQGEPAAVPLVVWRTEDGGAGWTHSQPIRVPFIGSDSASPYVVFDGGGHGWILGRIGGAGMHQYPVALYASDDDGATWQILAEPFGADDAGLTSCHKSGMAFGDGGLGVLTIDNCPITGAEVRLTSDGGQTWGAVSLPEPSSRPGLYEQASCESHSPSIFDPSEVVVAVVCRTFDPQQEVPFLYRSTDGGQTWTSGESAPGALTFVSPEVVWATNHDLYRSLDGGANWRLVKTVNWNGQFSFVTADMGWAVARAGQELALVRTQNGGSTWSIVEAVIGS